MHILAEQIRSLDDTVQAVDLGQSPADVIFLSFSDSDLGLMAAVHAELSGGRVEHPLSLSLPNWGGGDAAGSEAPSNPDPDPRLAAPDLSPPSPPSSPLPLRERDRERGGAASTSTNPDDTHPLPVRTFSPAITEQDDDGGDPLSLSLPHRGGGDAAESEAPSNPDPDPRLAAPDLSPPSPPSSPLPLRERDRERGGAASTSTNPADKRPLPVRTFSPAITEQDDDGGEPLSLSLPRRGGGDAAGSEAPSNPDPDPRLAAPDLSPPSPPSSPLPLRERDRERGNPAAASTNPTDTHPLPSLRLANLNALRHPYAVDLYLEKTAAHARLIVVRLLGGMDYWRYGLDELAMLARTRGIALAVIPGDDRPDPRLAEASTIGQSDLLLLEALFAQGGPDNMVRVFRWMAARLAGDKHEGNVAHRLADMQPTVLRPWGVLQRTASHRHVAQADCNRALLVFYRSLLLSGDIAPVQALAAALEGRGFEVTALYVTSLKDPLVTAELPSFIKSLAPDVILATTAFSARLETGGTVLDGADVPVIQLPMATTFASARAGNRRGLSATDLAMNVVLPEVDGRISGPAISFKAEDQHSQAIEFTRIRHEPDPDGIAAAADLAEGWARLRRKPHCQRKLALVLSNYPAKGGRTAYAVGLDGPASILAIADDLRLHGYDVAPLPSASDLIGRLEAGTSSESLELSDYQRLFSDLPTALQSAILKAWGDASADPDLVDGAFRLPALTAGRLIIAVQPDRGVAVNRATDHHDASLPPRHGYVAFYLWLRAVAGIDAMIHLGAHGTLEWLPGYSVALSKACAPLALVGGLPVVYPFIVNNPGEAAQARRRIAAVCLGHLTPPLTVAGTHGDLSELEAMVDEFSSAQAFDPRRAKLLSAAILDKAEALGIAEEAGLGGDLDPAAKLARLDAWICDVKDMRIGDGLHVYGRAPQPERLAAHLSALGTQDPDFAWQLASSAEGERQGLLDALDGRFVAPGPAGAPSLARRDVLPTGRNLYAVDPRGIPTRTAWEIGQRSAEEIVARYVQDHGDWPRVLILDVWASASMRSGGDDMARALALLGVRPTWDAGTARLSGFEVLALARLGRPRVDVTLRISGLFRDVFEGQIALFDSAVKAVAALDEAPEDNPLIGATALTRVFGAAPGAFGSGVMAAFDAGETAQGALGQSYLDASSEGYSLEGSQQAGAEFVDQIKVADAFVHVQDLAGQDLLSGDALVGHVGGFAAAAAALGAAPSLYHVDASQPDRQAVRTLSEAIALTVRARAANPRWIAGQMRHGHRGAAEIAETIANLCAFSATSAAVTTRQFDLLFDATFGDDRVRDFLLSANPQASAAALRHFSRAIADGRWPCRRNSVLGRLQDCEESLK